MKMNLFLVTAFLASLMFTAEARPLHGDGKKTAVVAKSLHFDAAETACFTMLPINSETTLMLFVTEYITMTPPDSNTLAGYKHRPPAKWECKG